jgi:hypothetical protein
MLPEKIRQALIDASKIDSHKPKGTSRNRTMAIDAIVEQAMLSNHELFCGRALRDKFPEKSHKIGEVVRIKTMHSMDNLIEELWGTL